VPGEKPVSVSLCTPQKLQVDNYATLSIRMKTIQNKRRSLNILIQFNASRGISTVLALSHMTHLELLEIYT
jgi:hypothetical protein